MHIYIYIYVQHVIYICVCVCTIYIYIKYNVHIYIYIYCMYHTIRVYIIIYIYIALNIPSADQMLLLLKNPMLPFGLGSPSSFMCQAAWWPPRTELGGSILNGHAQVPAAKPPEPRDGSWAGIGKP